MQLMVQHPVVVGCRVLRDMKRCYDVLPTMYHGWRGWFLLQKSDMDKEEVPCFPSDQTHLMKVRQWHKVVTVSASFFCIVGGLGSAIFSPSSQLYVLARLVDLVGLGLLFMVEPWIAVYRNQKEQEVGEISHVEHQEFEPLDTQDSERELKKEGSSHTCQQEPSSIPQWQHPIHAFSYTNLISHGSLFVARGMHVLAMCACLKVHKTWIIARTSFETLGLACALIPPVKTGIIVGLRTLDLRERLRMNSEAKAKESGLSALELDVLGKYLKRDLKIKRDLKTVKCVALALGRLGGHQSDEKPGMLSLYLGMNRLMEVTRLRMN